MMKATELLEKQHRKVESLFKRLSKGGGKAAQNGALEELASNLAAHMAIEQEIFYPAVRNIDEKRIIESFEEHALAEVALKRLLATPRDHIAFAARLEAVKDLVLQHVEEEEDELFPEVEESMDDDELIALGKRMKARFAEVLETGFEQALPKGTKTSSDIWMAKLSRSAAVNR
jgi:hemerythrin superfamily protein